MTKKPKAYIVCGAPGAGKTTYGKKLAAEKKAAFLDIDTATERLVRLALEKSGHDPDDRDSTHFKRHYRKPIYEQLFDTARDNLPFTNVVITGPFTKEMQDETWPDMLSKHLGTPVEVHYVFCQPEIRRERLEKRADPRDKAKLETWDSYIKYYGDENPPVCRHIFIDNS
jgi:predicted kinase